MVLRFFSSTNNLLCRRRTKIKLYVNGKRENAYFHVEAATGKREKWRENHGHVVTFAVRVSSKRDAKSIRGDLASRASRSRETRTAKVTT